MSLKVHYEILNQKGTPAFYSDVFANRPAYGFAGRVFISTDTGEIYEDTGTAWTLIADAGAGTTGTLQQVTTNGKTTNQGIVITAGNLGINTTTPGAPLDIHGTGTNAQFNGTGTNNAYLIFQNAGTNKWRIGNTYNAGANTLDIYNNTNSAIVASFNGNNSLLLNWNLGIKQGVSFSLISGYSNIGADSGGFYFNIGTANNAYLNFANLTNGRTFTFPDANGTLALTSQIPAASQWTTTGSNIYYNTGAVGIGTTVPLSYSNFGSLTLSGTSGGALFFANGATEYSEITGGASLFDFYQPNGDIRFRISGPTTAMTIKSTANVLIGTTTDNGNLLQVNGNISTGTKLAISNNAYILSGGQYTITLGSLTTGDIFTFTNNAGTVIGNNYIVGTLYVQIIGVTGGSNQFQAAYTLLSAGNGSANATLTAISSNTRGLNPISSIFIADDGAGGAIKIRATTIAGTSGAKFSITFVGNLS